MPRYLPWPERFWDRVNKTETCWLWTGYVSKGRTPGYGRIEIAGKQVAVHRWAYEDAYGPIPDGMVIDHLCRTPSCVRPDHLEAVSPRENVLRGVGPTADNAKKTHCKNGHDITSPGSYYMWGGHRDRYCKICWKARVAANKQRKAKEMPV